MISPTAVHSDLQPHVGLGPAAVREERLLARELELHRGARGAREQRRDDLEVQRLRAVAEPAADERLDHANPRFVHPQAAGERQMHVIGNLRHRMERQPVALGVVVGERGVGLHHRVRDLGVVELLLAHEVRGREAGVDVAERLFDLALDVAGLVRVQRRRVGRARRVRVEVRGQQRDVDLDRRQRGTGGGVVVGGHRGDRLAAIANAVAGERKLVLRDRDDPVGDVAVGAGDHGAHAGHCTGARRVEALDLAVRDGTSQDRADERAGGRQVRRIAGAARDLLDAVDQRLADADGGVGAGTGGFGSHRGAGMPVSTTACTDSMIFT